MPWKGETDPYKIWLSEIILQQTRVEQGLPYYLKFITLYPTIQDLADADDSSVFKVWEGLGYYSRCRNLLAGARQIMRDHNGIFPSDHPAILAIKGVGPYTAAAIASFAFSLPYAVVDGNVIRILARFFGIDTPFDTNEGKKKFSALAQQLLETASPADYNQAIMDFGATVCKPVDPQCKECPLATKCVAYNTQQTGELPVRSKKLVKKVRWFLYVLIRNQNKTLIRQRQTKDIWQHLHEFYLIENKIAFENPGNFLIAEFATTQDSIIKKSGTYTQQLTHQTIHARFIEITVAEIDPPEGYKWAVPKEMQQLAFPKIINTYMAQTEKTQPLLF